MNRVWELPLGDFSFFETGSVRDLAPYFLHWLEHPAYDDYWKQWSVDGRFGKIAVPAYHVGGWYDIFLNGTLRNYMGLKAHGATEAARTGQRLMIGPWYHDSVSFREGKAGDVSFAPEGCRNEEDEMLRWFDLTLEGCFERPGPGEARQDLRDGRERLARRGRLASGARSEHTLPPAFRRRSQFPERKWNVEPDAARSRTGRQIPLRSGESGTHAGRGKLLRPRPPGSGRL